MIAILMATCLIGLFVAYFAGAALSWWEGPRRAVAGEVEAS